MMTGGCPFSFGPKSDDIKGVQRITRHPDLMSLGLFGLGSACATVRLTEFFFGSFFFLFSLIGGAHMDHRHRLNGKMSKIVDETTSHIPFVALA